MNIFILLQQHKQLNERSFWLVIEYISEVIFMRKPHNLFDTIPRSLDRLFSFQLDWD